MSKFRTEHDTMGPVEVENDHLWGAQTQRSKNNFKIGREKMPEEIIMAFMILKSACAKTNYDLGKLDKEKCEAICSACEDVLSGKYPDEFPLVVWQTGSGTQSNMNANEVIAHIAMENFDIKLHPNDDVNMSQSSNDTFPTAMNIAALTAIKENLIPAMERMVSILKEKEEEYQSIIKIGRTHLQDAVPLKLSQEISGWRTMIEETKKMLYDSEGYLSKLAIGGTAVGTGLNCPKDFSEICCKYISETTKEKFLSAENKFHALTAKDAFVFSHGALKAIAANLMKIANDIRWSASGPRCGLGELSIPENEPGSSIMPGKVNPTQCEAITMIALQVMGNDATIGMAASQGNFELNVFMPVIAYNMLQSIRLLSDGINSFCEHCLIGLEPIREAIDNNLNNSLMLVTCLTPKIGYENAAACAKKAFKDNTTLKDAVLSLGFMDEAEYDKTVRPEKMV